MMRKSENRFKYCLLTMAALCTFCSQKAIDKKKNVKENIAQNETVQPKTTLYDEKPAQQRVPPDKKEPELVEFCGQQIRIDATSVKCNEKYIGWGRRSISKVIEKFSNLGKFTQLKELVLSGDWNDTESLPSALEIIYSLTTLEVLKMNEFVDPVKLKNLTQLRILHIRMHRDPFLKSLKYFKNLEELDLGQSAIKSLRRLRKLKHLKKLVLPVMERNIGDLSFLGELENLEVLSMAGIRYDPIGIEPEEIIDISPLLKLKKLRELNISTTFIKDIRVLGKLTTLESLTTGGNNVVSLDTIKGLVNLKKLEFRSDHEKNRNLDGLSEMKALRSLKLSGLSVEDSDQDPEFPASLYGLHELQLDKWVATNMEAFVPMRQLTRLQIRQAPNMKDLSRIDALPHLQHLTIYFSPIEDISLLANLKNLQTLVLTHCNIKDVSPLSQLSKLKSVDLTGTKVEDISPLDKISGLKKVIIEDTPAEKK